MKFEIGEVAIVAAVHPDFERYGIYAGAECTIIAPIVTEGGQFGYEVEVNGVMSPEGGNWHTAEYNLRKKRPPFEAGDWEDCVWNPSQHKQKAATPVET